jgi:hypothetical protein
MERLLTADWLNVEPDVLKLLRHEGIGPPYVGVSPRIIRLAQSDVRRWLEERSGKATPEQSA